MAYHGGTLASLYDPNLATLAAQEMAADGRDAQMEYAREFTPVSANPFSSPGRPPGTLKSRWRIRGPIMPGQRYGNPTWTGEFENWDPIAEFVENDTRPHLIRPSLSRFPASVIATGKPRRAGNDPQAALTWLTINGVRVFAREVKHPGTTGQHMTLRAATRAEVQFKTITRPALQRWHKRVIRKHRDAQPTGVIPGTGGLVF